MAPISIPTSSRLPSHLRLEAASSVVQRTLSRLSRSSLLSISIDWLRSTDRSLSAPYLAHEDDEDDDDQDDFYPPARSVDELQELYADMRTRKGSKREVVDRILEGDWRHGLSLYQLAMADFQYLHDHPTSQKWTAYRILPLRTPSPQDAENCEPPEVDKQCLAVPRFHPSSFLQNLQARVTPDVKAHYNFERHKLLPVLLLRIFLLDSPYNTALAATPRGGDNLPPNPESSRTLYVAFPDASPHIFLSAPQALGPAAAAAAPGDSARNLRALVLRALPAALSRPRERYALRPTGLAARNLAELLRRRGPGRAAAAAAGWGLYADDSWRESPLDTVTPRLPPPDEDAEPAGDRRKRRAASPAAQRDRRAVKRARRVARARFGDFGKVDDGCGVERLDVLVEDPFPLRHGHDTSSDDGQIGSEREGGRSTVRRRSQLEELLLREREAGGEDEDPGPGMDDGMGVGWRPSVRLTFHGPHVFAGIRQLVESGVVDGERMPGWMTGEEGVTIGAVRNGRIRGHKGSGI